MPLLLSPSSPERRGYRPSYSIIIIIIMLKIVSDSAMEEEAEEQLLGHHRFIDANKKSRATTGYPKAKKHATVEARGGAGLKSAATKGIGNE